MASVTLKNSRLPAGSSVGAYVRTSDQPGAGAPSGSAVDTSTVGTTGTLTFQNLEPGTRYWAYVFLDPDHVYVGFETDPSSAVDASEGVAASISPRIPAVRATSLTYGTDKTPVATETYLAEIHVPANVDLTGIEVLIGSVGGTDKFVGILYDHTGAVVANTALAGTTVGTTATFQQIPFTEVYEAEGPQMYFIGVQVNGTTARLRTIPVGPRLAAGKKTGEVFGTPTAITPLTSFTADLGPVANTY